LAKRSVSLHTRLESAQSLPALVDRDRTITYAEFHRLVGDAADKLTGYGIQSGERVGVVAENSTELVLVLMGLLHAGAVACPLSYRNPEGAIVNMLASVDCPTVVHSPTVTLSSKNIRKISLSDLTGPLSGYGRAAEIEMDRDATILFTSGTSAVPKAVVHSFGNHYYSALGSNENIVLKPGDRWLLALPLFHVGGLSILFRCFISGATVVVADSDQSIGDAVEEFGVSHLSLVPTQLERLLENPPSQTSARKIKSVLVGGGFTPRRLIEKGVQRGLRLHTTYGLTEMASQVTTTLPLDRGEKLYSSGRVLNFREIKISEGGEISVRGKTLFKGYLSPSGLESPLDSQGWYATGDVGRIDADGYLHVIGRRDNMFISGGENIHPEEIERVIGMLDEVEKVIVVPIGCAVYGHRPVAFVKFVPGSGTVTDRLLRLLSERLPKFKIPVRILDWPQIVPGQTLKLDRVYFRNLAERWCR
jgi:O-succinylbenzoic acid--CoA ligase